MKKILTLVLCFLTLQNYGQNTILSALELIEQQFSISIFALEEYIPARNIDFNLSTYGSVEEALDNILSNSGLAYITYDNNVIVIAPKDRVERAYTQEYFLNRKTQLESIDNTEEEVEITEVGRPGGPSQEGVTKIRGFVIDDYSDEPLIGATILVDETGTGTVTNEIGLFELNVPTGEYNIIVSSIGYIDRTVRTKIFSSGNLDVGLAKEAIQIEEVVVTGRADNQNVRGSSSGLEVLSIKEIKKLPAFLGEVDVVKSLLLLPGVSTVGEGSGGFNVRGGTVDQNLIMQDGLYLFNSSHVLGLFSLFNPDIVNSVNLYKGSIPAKYGGRLSSVLDVELKDGNFQKLSGKGGIGLASSRFTLEAPLKKGESSILFAARSSYSDWIFDVVKIADIRESSAFFYDTNLKLTQRFSSRGKLTVNLYASNDRFKFNENFDFNWKTLGATVKFNYLINNKLSFSFESVYAQYKSRWDEPESNRAFQLDNGIDYIKIRPEFIYNPTASQTINFGIVANSYTVDPGSIIPVTSESITIPKIVDEEKGRDVSFYINDELELTDNLSLALGARYTIFQNVGPSEVSLYEPGFPLSQATLSGSQTYGSGEVIATYTGIEPRASLRIGLDDQTSVKLSYNRTQQFINQISNSTAVSPIDVWQLSNEYIQPQKAHNYSFGVFKNLKDNLWETSIEVFYRDIDNLIEYKDLANLLVNDHLETELVNGIGRAYGVEISIKKTAGRFNGWLGYTYSRTERKTSSQFQEEAINGNEWFLSNYDKPHDLSLALSYQISKRNYFSANFVYSSGRPITAPTGKLSVDNLSSIPLYSARNAFRIPDYHRLDLSYTIEQSHKINQFWRSSWTFSIYNLYSRRNAFTVFFTQNASQNVKTNRLSILGSAFPSITYNFNF